MPMKSVLCLPPNMQQLKSRTSGQRVYNLKRSQAYCCHASLAHTSDVTNHYLDTLNGVFALIAQCESARSVEELLEGPVCHGGFKRLN